MLFKRLIEVMPYSRLYISNNNPDAILALTASSAAFSRISSAILHNIAYKQQMRQQDSDIQQQEVSVKNKPIQQESQQRNYKLTDGDWMTVLQVALSTLTLITSVGRFIVLLNEPHQLGFSWSEAQRNNKQVYQQNDPIEYEMTKEYEEQDTIGQKNKWSFGDT
ncbi:MAG: hypothetical protein EZS28_055360, partial [Streblomastix strix]